MELFHIRVCLSIRENRNTRPDIYMNYRVMGGLAGTGREGLSLPAVFSQLAGQLLAYAVITVRAQLCAHLPAGPLLLRPALVRLATQ